jgi:hypothetical protein
LFELPTPREAGRSNNSRSKLIRIKDTLLKRRLFRKHRAMLIKPMQSRNWFALGLLPLFTAAFAADAGAIDLVLRELTHSNSYAVQVVAATNNTGYPVKTLKLQCAFYRDQVLLAFGRAFADDVPDGQTVYIEVIAEVLADKAAAVNRATCNVVDTVWKE